MTPDELRVMFRQDRATFAARYPHVAGVTLHIVKRKCPEGSVCAPRELAWYINGRIFILARALRLSRLKCRALLAHELGHASDRRLWQRGSEQRADDIAEKALGLRIRYDPKHFVQTFGPGIYPRPKHLHS